MDPVTAAIIAAVAAGAAAGAQDVAQTGIADAYNGLKALIKRKFGKEGETSEVVKAVEDLEAKPESKGKQMVLSEAVEESGADKDEDVLKAVQDLTALLKKSNPQAAKFIIQAENVQGVTNAERIENLTQTFGDIVSTK